MIVKAVKFLESVELHLSGSYAINSTVSVLASSIAR